MLLHVAVTLLPLMLPHAAAAARAHVIAMLLMPARMLIRICFAIIIAFERRHFTLLLIRCHAFARIYATLILRRLLLLC